MISKILYRNNKKIELKMDELKKIVASVLAIRLDKISGSLSRNDEEWDSFNHLMLVSEIEKKLGIRFTINEIKSIKSYRDLSEIVSKKTK